MEKNKAGERREKVVRRCHVIVEQGLKDVSEKCNCLGGSFQVEEMVSTKALGWEQV